MVYLLHGPDTVSSRNFLLKLKNQYQATTTLDLKKTKGQLDFPTESLFARQGLLVLENSLPKEAGKIVERVQGDLVIWLSETVETVPNWVNKNLNFKLAETTTTFKLVDLVFQGQEKQALIVLERLLLENTPPELIVGSLIRQLKLLALALSGEVSKISASSFVQKKITDQARVWSLKKIKSAGLFLLRADLNLKRGLLPTKLNLENLVLDLCQLVAS